MVTGMDMQVHPDILETLTKRFLPYLIRIQDMDTPWPAQLWINDECVHREGVAMFNIGDRGYLTAEYFAHDKHTRSRLCNGGTRNQGGASGHGGSRCCNPSFEHPLQSQSQYHLHWGPVAGAQNIQMRHTRLGRWL